MFRAIVVLGEAMRAGAGQISEGFTRPAAGEFGQVALVGAGMDGDPKGSRAIARWALGFGLAWVSLALPWQGEARAQVVQVEPALDRVELETGKDEAIKVRVALRGLGQSKGARTPLNVAFVLDRSEAMGPHLAEAKQAILAGVEALEPEDTVAIVLFDDTVELLVESARVGDVTGLAGLLDGVTAGGRAGVFAGVVKGAVEVRKALARERVNRIVLMNAGGTEVGPKSPLDMSQLAASLRRDGIGVTTVGMGLAFDEDLLLALAEESGGEHVFVEDSKELPTALRSLVRQLGAIVARDASVRLTFGGDTDIVRVLGRRAEVLGSIVSVPMPAVEAGETEDLVLEARLPTRAQVGQAVVATVETLYVNLRTGAPEKVSMVLMANFVDEAGTAATAATGAQKEGRPRVAPEVEIASACWEARLLLREVVLLRDRGETQRARAKLDEGIERLVALGERFDSAGLRRLASALREDGEGLDVSDWPRQRKIMRERTCASLKAPGPAWKRRF